MTIEATVAAREAAFLKALFAGNRSECEPFLSPDFSALRANGDHTIEVVLRDPWLDELGGRDAEEVDVTDTVISAHGDVALATTLWVENPSSEPRTRSSTDVWAHSSDGWHLIERHIGWCATRS